MSFLPERLKIQTFSCPYCRKYVSSEAKVCQHCSTPLTEDLKDFFINKELRQQSETALRSHRNSMYLGAAMISLACFIFTVSELATDCATCPLLVLLIVGLVYVMKGLLGFLEEKRKLQND